MDISKVAEKRTTYIYNCPLAQAGPVKPFNQIVHSSAAALLHILHVAGELPCLVRLGLEMVEERQIGVERNIVRRLGFLFTVRPLLGGFYQFCCHGDRSLAHERRPVIKTGVGCDKHRSRRVSDHVGLWLAEQVVGHGHASYCLKLFDRNSSRGCKSRIRNG